METKIGPAQSVRLSEWLGVTEILFKIEISWFVSWLNYPDYIAW